MGITLNNIGDGGSINITLNKVVDYTIVRSNSYAEKDIPAKSTPTVDTDTTLRYPTKYKITTVITDKEKGTLSTLAEETGSTCLLSDGILANKNVRPERVEFGARPGYADLPWIAVLLLKAEDH